MQDPSADLQNRVLLLKGRRLRIMRDRDSRLVVRSSPSWIYAFLMGVVVLLTIFMVQLSAMMIWLGLFPPKPDPAKDTFSLVVGLCCTLVCIGLFLGVVYLFLGLALPRVTVIDLAAGTIRFRHIPGTSRDLQLADVLTVDLVMMAEKGTCHLGFHDRGAGAVYSIHWLGGQFDSAVKNRDSLLPAARLISRFIDKPLESSWGTIRWRLRKGPSEPLPPE